MQEKISIFKTLIICLLLSKRHFFCSIPRGFKFATIDDQVSNAGAIVMATAVKNFAEDKVNQGNIEFREVKFLKGCGPSVLTVEGFKNSAACGAGIPVKGDRVILFLCPGSDSTNWTLNDFSISTGVLFLKYKKGYEKTIPELVLKKYGSLGKCSTLSKCTKKLRGVDKKPKDIQNPTKKKSKIRDSRESSEDGSDETDKLCINSVRLDSEIDTFGSGQLLDASDLSDISEMENLFSSFAYEKKRRYKSKKKKANAINILVGSTKS